MKIKVCGLKEPDNIQAVAGLNPDYMGFIFYENSPRYVGELTGSSLTGLNAIKTGVFVDAPFNQIVEAVEGYDLDAVQLHGNENPEICRLLKEHKPVIQQQVTMLTRGGREIKKERSVIASKLVLPKKVIVIKAFGIDAGFDFNRLNAYADAVDYFLFDTKTVQHGGSGKMFDWDLLNNYQLQVPFFLSGGLSLDKLAEIKNIKHPAFYGVDLNSRFDTEPGIKDTDKLKQAFEMLNTTTNEIRS